MKILLIRLNFENSARLLIKDKGIISNKANKK